MKLNTWYSESLVNQDTKIDFSFDFFDLKIILETY